jgi:acetamidase/formamidase
MPIIRREDVGASTAQFTVGVNVVLVGSKKLSSEEQEALLSVEKVRILIADVNDPENVLVDAEVPAREFSTGSVGYGLNLRGVHFKKQNS